MQRHLAISTNPQDLEHHLLVIPGFSGNLTSCFLHFTVTAKPGGQTMRSTEEEKGGSASRHVQHFKGVICHTHKKKRHAEYLLHQAPFLGAPLAVHFFSPSRNSNNKLSHWHNHLGTLLCNHLCPVAASSQHKMLLENSNLFISCTPVALGSVIKRALLAAGSQAVRFDGDHRSVCKYRSGRVQPFGMREKKINATSPLRATGTLHLSNCIS